MEKGLAPSSQDFPKSTHPGNKVVNGRSENRAALRSSVILISRSRRGSEDSMDDTSRKINTGEELKLEDII